MYGKLKNDVREIISILCKYKDVQIIDGAVCEDHIHLSVAIPPKISISSFMGYLKGKSTLMLYDRHPELQSKRDKSFWARGYYVSTIGNITENAIKKYIQEQYSIAKVNSGRSIPKAEVTLANSQAEVTLANFYISVLFHAIV